MEMKKAGKIQYLESTGLIGNSRVRAGFTTRHEGVSRPPYNSLNLGSGTFDSVHSVEGNRSLLARAMGGTLDQLVTVTQVHGVDLLVIDGANHDLQHFQRLECDGIICNQPGIMIGICVADCVPVLLHDSHKSVVAALHAGWRGTAAGICRKGVEAMVTLFGSRPQDIRAAIGPAIGPCCYEVDQPVIDAFAADTSLPFIAKSSAVGKWRLDLPEANLRQLVAAGIPEQQIERTDLCVSCNPELFFSYRRDKGETGRQMGFISLSKG
jgi:YfiH family protein